MTLVTARAAVSALAAPASRGELSHPQVPRAERILFDILRICAGRAPLATDDSPEQTPTVTIFESPRKWIDGAAVIIAPGGGYESLVTGWEGDEPAAWMVCQSATAFVLKYRVGPQHPSPFLC